MQVALDLNLVGRGAAEALKVAFRRLIVSHRHQQMQPAAFLVTPYRQAQDLRCAFDRAGQGQRGCRRHAVVELVKLRQRPAMARTEDPVPGEPLEGDPPAGDRTDGFE